MNSSVIVLLFVAWIKTFRFQLFLVTNSLYTISVFMYISMLSKDHRIFWNLQDLLSICLEKGDTPVHFAYRRASEGFLVAEKWAKPYCTSNFRNMVHWSQSPSLLSIFRDVINKKVDLKKYNIPKEVQKSILSSRNSSEVQQGMEDRKKN